MNRILKRLLMLCISFLLIFSAITPAFAGMGIDEIDCRRRAKILSNDPEVRPFGNYEKGFFTHNLIGGKPHLLSMFYNKTRNVYMYCIEPGAPAHSGKITATDELENCDYWKKLDRNHRRSLLLALMYGYPNVNYPDLCDCDEYAATQSVIWSIFGKPNAININESMHARAAVERLTANISKFDIIPSFKDQTVRLKWDGKAYKGSLTDTNNVLSAFPTPTASGVSISRNGNTLDFSATAALKTTIKTPSVVKNTPKVDDTLCLFWAKDQQTMASGTEKVDPPKYNLSFETDHGTMKIVKKSENGNVSGWQFRITGKGINKTVKTGKDGTIAVDLPVQEYTIEEINLPEYIKKPQKQKVKLKYHQTASVSFENKYKQGKVQVVKVDKETNKPIAATDAVFEAQTKVKGGKYKILGKLKYNPSLKLYETDNIKITEYNGGVVRIYERKAPTGYVKNTNDFYEAKLTKDGQLLKITLTNSKNEGGLKIIKKSDSGNIKDIEFRITGNGINKTVKTGKDGTIASKLLPGEYTVEELNVSRYFKQPPKQKVKIKYGETAILNFNNKFKKINITLLKLDGESKKPIEASDAVFEVAEKINGTEKWQKIGVMKYKNGKYVLNDIYTTHKNNGIFKITEIKAPTGYIKSAKEYILNLKETPFADGQTFEIGKKDGSLTGVTNSPQKGKITLIKTDKETGKVLKDCVLALYAAEDIKQNGEIKFKKGEKIAEKRTDDHGTAEFTDLYLGLYKAEEVKAPTGYLNDSTPQIIELKYAGQEKQIVFESGSFTNSPQKGKITLIKTDKETGKVLKDCVLALYAAEDIKQNGEIKFKKGEKIAEKRTDDHGTAEFTDLYLGLYKAEEVKAPTGYLNDSTPQIIELKYEGQEKQIVFESGSFTNAPQKGKVRIVKTGEVFSGVEVIENEGGFKTYKPIFTEKPLKGAVYGIFAKEDIFLSGELKYKKDAEIARITTDTNGVAQQDNIYLGKFYIKELEAPDGYILNPDPQEIELTYNGEEKEIVSNISFLNERQKFEISLLKETEKDEKAKLGDNGEILNVIFGLYAAEDFTASNGETIPKDALIETGSPDKNGFLKFTADLPQGKVYVKEISTDKAYVLDGKAYNITLKYEGHTIKVIPVFANDKKPIFNKLKSGTLEITKKDISDGKLLPDTGFRIKDENGKVIAEGKTDKNGIAKFSLRYGKYTYREFNAPKGYLIDEKEYPFEITKDGQVIKAVMTNKKIPEKPKVILPKTGKLGKTSKAYITTYVAVGTVSVAAVVIFALKKKKDEE